jgi:hypothetical protein
VTPQAAKSAALGCVIATGAVASVSSISAGELPPLRIGVGVFVAGAALLALADSAPELAAGFGFLLLAGAVLRDGIPAAQSLGHAFGTD